MTETTTQPVERPETTAPPAPEKPPPTSADGKTNQAGKTTTQPAHTPGGYPAAPLMLSGANSAAGLVGAAGLSGGPVAAAGAAAGAAVLGAAAAAARSRRQKNRSQQARQGNRLGASRGTRGRGGGGRLRAGGAGGGRSGSSRTGSAAGRRGAGTTGSGAGRSGGTRAAGLRNASSRNGTSRAGGSSTAAGGRAGRGSGAKGPGSGAGRVGQVRGLRADKAANTPSRSAGRKQQTADRRNVADARRAARQNARAAQAASRGGRSTAGRMATWGRRKTAAAARRAVEATRRRRDRATDQQVKAKRSTVRKAPARRSARWALLRSAARFHARRVLAGLLVAPAGLVGLVTTPLGRRLNLPWLIHPGRRLYHRLIASARHQRDGHDTDIRARLAEAEAAADAAPEGDITDRVERPTHLTPRIPAPGKEIHVSGFKFEEAAAEMAEAARTYDPEGNMEVVGMVDNLPQAMECVAQTFLILAERSDEEFAFEKDVAAAFNDIYQSLMNAVDAADDAVKVFRQVHEQDISRHEDPRNGSEAEKGWNV